MMARLGILLALAAASLQFVALFDRDLRLPDEPREAEIAREYATREGWAVPTLNGGRWLEKPPLYHWIVATLFQVTEKATPGLARLPSALAGLGIGVLAWLMMRRLGPPGMGPTSRWAAAFLAWTSAELMNASHVAMVDALFAFLVTAALFCFALGHLTEGRNTPLWNVLFAFAAGLSFLAKAHLGPVLIGVSVLACCGLRGDFKPIRSLLSPLPLLVFLGTVLPWPALLWMREHQADLWHEEVARLAGKPGTSDMAFQALREVLWGQMLDRTQGGSYGHAQPAWYYLPRLFTYAAPASLALPFALPWAWKRRREPLVALCAGWIVGSVLLLSLPSAKRAIYLVPCVAPAAVLVALWGREKIGKRLLLATGLLAMAGALALPSVFPEVRLWAWVLGMLAASVLLRALVGKPREALGVLGVWILAAWLAVGQSQGARLDTTESFAPLAGEMTSRAARRVIVGYRLSENLQGAFCFALGQRVSSFTEPKNLLESLREGRRLVVMPQTAWEELPGEAKALLRMELEREVASIRFVVATTGS